MKKYTHFLVFIALTCFISCDKTPDPLVNPYQDISGSVHFIEASAQRLGDPQIGQEYLLTGDYIDSGIPRGIYDSTLGTSSAKLNELNRSGINEDLEFGLTGIINQDGVELVVANCMQCHAGYVDNQFIFGLGNTFADYTSDQSAAATLLDNFVISTYGENSDEYKAYAPFSRGLKATGPYLITETVGSNAADKLALVLAANRNPGDLTWTDDLLFEIPAETPPSDVPAWWHMGKKNAMFSTGLGKGDFSKHMMTASILTLEDTIKANEVDALFPDVLAFIKSIEAPVYAGNIDTDAANRGQFTFEEVCSKCHGTYGDIETYPNLFVDRSLIETDPAIADGTSLYNDFVDWYNNSWFSNSEFPSEYDVVDGYMAPPLDGIWATAPYLHNGSVPTLYHLLESGSRPKIWRKASNLSNYDHQLMGLTHTVAETKVDNYSYDTSLDGYTNKGHYFADFLTNEQRADLLEYLKSL